MSDPAITAITQRMAEVLAETCNCCKAGFCNAFMHYTQAERVVAALVESGEIPTDSGRSTDV